MKATILKVSISQLVTVHVYVQKLMFMDLCLCRRQQMCQCIVTVVVSTCILFCSVCFFKVYFTIIIPEYLFNLQNERKNLVTVIFDLYYICMSQAVFNHSISTMIFFSIMNTNHQDIDKIFTRCVNRFVGCPCNLKCKLASCKFLSSSHYCMLFFLSLFLQII